MLDINLIYDELPKDKLESELHFIRRTAVRGIIYDGDQLIMVKTRLGDYKFPGGGVKEGETHQQALRREIQEETGYTDVTIGNCFGSAFEQNIDWFEGEGTYFQMRSFYYICHLNSPEKKESLLEDYEAKLGYEAVRVDPAVAYEANIPLREMAFAKSKAEGNRYLPVEFDGLDRETEVLARVKDLSPENIAKEI